ncbi:MAG: DUF6090 family protein [Robiginitalea sp.]|jgi:hypothetical protein
MSENTRKYLLYAAGEVLLVVVGILIALQIDTWNEQRKERRAELEIIDNLRQEFQHNRKELDSILRVVSMNRDANRDLMGFFGRPKEELATLNIDSIVFFSIEFQRFIPTQNALTDLLQSGRLQLIRDESLKSYLYDWTRIMGQIDESYSGVKQKTEEDIVPYLSKRYPLKDIDKYGALNWKQASELPNSKLEVFRELEFENLVDDHLYRLMRYERDLRKGKAVIGSILLQIQSNP